MPDATLPHTSPDPSNAGIEGLKKMSTTAGLGSGDYAAVNTLSVVAAMAVLISPLAFMANLLLVLPIAAALCGVIAVRQIRASNGTQTGLKWAIPAIVVHFGVIGFVIGGQYYRDVQNKPDAQEILAVMKDLNDRVAARDYAGAYQLSTPQFRARVKEDRFVQTLLQFEANADTGAIASIEWNGTPIDFQTDPQSSLKSAWVGTLFKYRKNFPANRVPLGFVKVEGKWGLNEVPALFK